MYKPTNPPKAQQIPGRINTKETKPQYIIIKLLKTKEREIAAWLWVGERDTSHAQRNYAIILEEWTERWARSSGWDLTPGAAESQVYMAGDTPRSGLSEEHSGPRVRTAKKPRWDVYGMGNDSENRHKGTNKGAFKARGPLDLNVGMGSKRKQHLWLGPEWWEVSTGNGNTEGGASLGVLMSSVLSSVHWQCPGDIPVEVRGGGTISVLLRRQRPVLPQLTCIRLTLETLLKYKFLLSKYLTGPRHLSFNDSWETTLGVARV